MSSSTIALKTFLWAEFVANSVFKCGCASSLASSLHPFSQLLFTPSALSCFLPYHHPSRSLRGPPYQPHFFPLAADVIPTHGSSANPAGKHRLGCIPNCSEAVQCTPSSFRSLKFNDSTSVRFELVPIEVELIPIEPQFEPTLVVVNKGCQIFV